MNDLPLTSLSIGILGVLVTALGVMDAVWRFTRSEYCSACRRQISGDRKKFRLLFGYDLLLGLEFLIAADIIGTLAKPSVQVLTMLGAIVLILPLISLSLNAELKSEYQTKTTPA